MPPPPDMHDPPNPPAGHPHDPLDSDAFDPGSLCLHGPPPPHRDLHPPPAPPRCRRLLRHMAITQRLLTTRASQALLHPVTTSFNILFPMNYPEPVQVTVKATSTPTCLPDPYASSTLTASQQAKL
jgi:hypothetical protein